MDEPSAAEVAAEEQRERIVFEQLELIEVQPGAEQVLCVFFSASGAREAGRLVLKPSVHWFRCALPRQDPLVELVLDGGFYIHSEFGPRGMELGRAVASGWLARHERSAFPEHFWLEEVRVTGWRP